MSHKSQSCNFLIETDLSVYTIILNDSLYRFFNFKLISFIKNLRYSSVKEGLQLTFIS
jgi:hypothetical protein